MKQEDKQRSQHRVLRKCWYGRKSGSRKNIGTYVILSIYTYNDPHLRSLTKPTSAHNIMGIFPPLFLEIGQKVSRKCTGGHVYIVIYHTSKIYPWFLFVLRQSCYVIMADLLIATCHFFFLIEKLIFSYSNTSHDFSPSSPLRSSLPPHPSNPTPSFSLFRKQT